jgi:hypothetical protein
MLNLIPLFALVILWTFFFYEALVMEVRLPWPLHVRVSWKVNLYVRIPDMESILISPVKEEYYWFDACVHCDANNYPNFGCPFFIRAWQMELDGDLDSGN